MLAVLGFLTLGTFMVLVMRKYATAFVAIIAAPVFFAILAGRGGDLGDFAILYFGVMMDARLFDPLSRAIIRLSKGDPARICVGTAVLSLLVGLDGLGTTSYVIICSAFLPIYRRLGINPLVIGQVLHSVGPASAPLWVLLGLIKRDLGDFQRFALRWVVLASSAWIGIAVLTGAISVV